MDFSFSNDLNFSPEEQLPGLEALAAFTVDSQSVFSEDSDIVPILIDDKLSYILWGRRQPTFSSSTEWEINVFRHSLAH